MARHRLPLVPAFLFAALAALALGACKPAAPPAPAATAAASAAPATPSVADTVASLNPLSSPKDEIKAAMEKFMVVKSYHASMHMESGPRGEMNNEIDFVGPDRYRMAMQGLGNQVIIGDTMYMSVRGKTMKVPMPAGTLSQWRDPAKLAENEATMTVQAQGRDSIDGTTARKYLVRNDKPDAPGVTMWIGDDDLPLQIQVKGLAQGKMGVTTIRYSRFDDPSIEIQPPQ